MTALPETSLAFARECMGWGECKAAKLYKPSIMGNATAGREVMERFACDDLNSVMDAVTKWCADHEDTGFTIHFTRRGLWEVVFQREHMNPPDALSEEYPSGSDDLCHALMLACLDAARKLKDRAS